MVERILSALVLVPAVLALVVFAPPWLMLIAVGFAGLLCLREYFGLASTVGYSGRPWFGYASFALLLAAFHLRLFPPLPLLSVFLIACFIEALWNKDPARDRVTTLFMTFLGILYFALCLYPAVALRYDFGERLGIHWTMVLLATIWSGDVAALLVGRLIGRTPFAPILSPRKTNEGAIGGLLAGTLTAVALGYFAFPELPLRHVALASLLTGAAGQLGDLSESMLKRAAGVKDSSDLIPGHGGILDRMDSLMFALPTQYIYLLCLYGS